MEVVSLSSPPPVKYVADYRYPDLSGKLSEDFGSKLKMGDSREEEEEEERRNLEKSMGNDGETTNKEEVEEDEEEEEEEEEEEFSFASVNNDGSPITADEAFEDGLIRPVYPLFDRDLLIGFEYYSNDSAASEGGALRPPLRKLFVEDHDGGSEDSAAESVETEPLGPYCSWSGKTVAEASPETCRKSNSTGFSKLWRFRDLILRSNSDGKDTFVFLNNEARDKSQSSSKEKTMKKGKEETTSWAKKKAKEAVTGKKAKEKTASSAHEKLYVRNRAIREEGKRRSYLTYKHVGFFTDVNGLSRNIHPF